MKRILFTHAVVALLALLPLAVRADEITLSQTVQASQTAVYQIELHNETEPLPTTMPWRLPACPTA